MSLRLKLIALVGGLTTLLLGALGVYLTRSVSEWGVEVVDRDLEDRAGTLSRALHWEHGEWELEDEETGAALSWPYRIETAEGRTLTSAGLDWSQLSADVPDLSTHFLPRKGPVRVLTREFETGHGRVVISVAAPLGTLARVTQRLETGLVVAIVLAALLGALGAALIAQLFLSPLRRLSKEIAAVEENALGNRLTTKGLDPELSRLANAFNAVLARLEQAFEAQRAFVARASHALRTPLASIRSQSEVALRRERPDADYRAALDEIAREAADAGMLADGLLALNRADAAKGAGSREEIDPAELAAEIDRLFRSRAEQQGLELETSSSGSPFRADRARLREMLDALIDNALRYTPKGGRVRFGVKSDPGGVVLEVLDSGLGIRPDELQRVTERFFRGSAAEETKQPGSGLGLSVVRALAEAEGAELRLEAAQGGGTRATLRYPPERLQ